jgi:hypothetical protein
MVNCAARQRRGNLPCPAIDLQDFSHLRLHLTYMEQMQRRTAPPNWWSDSYGRLFLTLSDGLA